MRKGFFHYATYDAFFHYFIGKNEKTDFRFSLCLMDGKVINAKIYQIFLTNDPENGAEYYTSLLEHWYFNMQNKR